MISILLCDGCQVSVNFSLGQHPATNRIVYYLLTVTTRPTPYKLVSLSRPFLVANAINIHRQVQKLSSLDLATSSYELTPKCLATSTSLNHYYYPRAAPLAWYTYPHKRSHVNIHSS